MKINWGIRFRQKYFLMALFSFLVLLGQQIGAFFGYEVTSMMSEQLLSIVNTVLSILVLLGVVVDPTTCGMSDSERARMYRRPR